MSVHSPLPLPDDDQGTVGIWYIRRRLGRTDFKDRRIVRYVQLLVDEKGFPPPLPSMKRDELEHGVTVSSQWLRTPVDAWLADLLPPDNAMSVDRAAMAAAAQDMDTAAAGLRLLQGGRA